VNVKTIKEKEKRKKKELRNRNIRYASPGPCPRSQQRKATESSLSKDGREKCQSLHVCGFIVASHKHMLCTTCISFQPFFKPASFLPLFSVLWG
jgi:hypothetical protein